MDVSNIFRLYEAAPWSGEAWCTASECFSLAATRLAWWRRAGGGGGGGGGGSGGGGAAALGVRAGTPAGLAVRALRADTPHDLAAVAGALVDGAHHAVRSQPEFTFSKWHSVGCYSPDLRANSPKEK